MIKRKEITEADIIRTLSTGAFICLESEPEMFNELKKGEQSLFFDSIVDGLNHLALELKQDEILHPNYFYATSVKSRLNLNYDLKTIRDDFNQILKNRSQSFTGFIELLNKAYGHDIPVEVSQEFDIGRTQSALNNPNNVELNTLFRSVSRTPFFKNSLKKPNDKERFDEMVNLMLKDGLVKDDGTGNNFAFTGKFIFQVELIIKVRQSISPVENIKVNSEQIHLI